MNNPFSRNLAPKIISILFALIMWTYVMSVTNPQDTRTFSDVSVHLLNQELLNGQDLVLMSGEDQTIRVTLAGRRDELYAISKDDIRITADIEGYREGVSNIPLENNTFPNIELTLSPKTIRVELEEIVRVQKEVQLSIQGDPQVGYVLNDAQYRPTVVWIEGPESYVNDVDRVVAILEVGGAKDNIAASLPLKAVDARGNEVAGVELKSTYTDVNVAVDHLKTVRLLANSDTEAAEGYMITDVSVVPTQITLRGQESIVSKLTSIETVPLILDGLTESVTQPFELVLPEGVTKFDEEMPTLSVEVRPTVTTQFELTKDNITFLGIQSGLSVDVELIAESIQLSIEAVAEYLEDQETDDIELVFDVSELGEGEHEITPALIVGDLSDAYIKGYELSPSSFTVRIGDAIE